MVSDLDKSLNINSFYFGTVLSDGDSIRSSDKEGIVFTWNKSIICSSIITPKKYSIFCPILGSGYSKPSGKGIVSFDSYLRSSSNERVLSFYKIFCTSCDCGVGSGFYLIPISSKNCNILRSVLNFIIRSSCNGSVIYLFEKIVFISSQKSTLFP